MPIVPDAKNWTWVLERSCPECGFDPEPITSAAVPELAREYAWDQDCTAVVDHYDKQDPRTVGAELTDAAEAVARAFRSVPGAALGNQARRSDGSVFTLESLAGYFLHDVIHHVHDVRG